MKLRHESEISSCELGLLKAGTVFSVNNLNLDNELFIRTNKTVDAEYIICVNLSNGEEMSFSSYKQVNIIDGEYVY